MESEKHHAMILDVISYGFIITGFIFGGIANLYNWKPGYIILIFSLIGVIIAYYAKKVRSPMSETGTKNLSEIERDNKSREKNAIVGLIYFIILIAVTLIKPLHNIWIILILIFIGMIISAIWQPLFYAGIYNRLRPNSTPAQYHRAKNVVYVYLIVMGVVALGLLWYSAYHGPAVTFQWRY